MFPEFTNPHSLSQSVETTTRSKIAERAGLTSIVQDDESRTLKRDLETMLQDTWASALAESSTSSRLGKHRKMSESRKIENVELSKDLLHHLTLVLEHPIAFRLVSSMKHPRYISLDPRPPPPSVSREPDCEDDEIQAETRKIRSLSVAVEFESLREAVSTWQINTKAVAIGAKIPLARTPFSRPLPCLLVTEEARASSCAQSRGLQSPAASPHEPRPSCDVLPVKSASGRTELPGKRKRDRKRPLPAYWRPSPDLGGKCMGHALGYPSSWAPACPRARDTMKRGVESGHAVQDESG